MAEAVNMIAEERAPVTTQTEMGATYDPMLNKPNLTKLNLQQLGVDQERKSRIIQWFRQSPT